MKKHGHYCKVCGEYKANEKFSGKGHNAHICKSCAALSPEKRAEEMALTRLHNLPWMLSKAEINWLKKCRKHRSEAVKALANEQYGLRFARREKGENIDDFDSFDELGENEIG